MGFFTNNWQLADSFNNPSVGRTQAFMPGAGSMSSTQNLNPFQQQPGFGAYPQQVQSQVNWGAPTQGTSFNPQQGYSNQDSFNQNFLGQYNPNVPWWQQGQMNTQPYQPQLQQQQPLQQPIQSSDGGSDYVDNTPVSEFDPAAFGDIDWTSIGLGLINPVLGLGYSLYNNQDQSQGNGMFGDLGQWWDDLVGNTSTDLNVQAATNNDYWDNYSESVAPDTTTNVGPYNYDTYSGIGVGGSDVGVETPSSSSDSSNDYGSSDSGWGSNDSSGSSYSADDAGDAAAASDWGDDDSGGWGW